LYEFENFKLKTMAEVSTEEQKVTEEPTVLPFHFTIDEINTLYVAASNMPFKQVHALMSNIKAQFEKHIADNPELVKEQEAANASA
jgi:hypothetical protein